MTTTFNEDEEIAKGMVPQQWMQDINRIVYVLGLAVIPAVLLASFYVGQPTMIALACVLVLLAVWSLYCVFKADQALNGAFLTPQESIRWNGMGNLLLAYTLVPGVMGLVFLPLIYASRK